MSQVGLTLHVNRGTSHPTSNLQTLCPMPQCQESEESEDGSETSLPGVAEKPYGGGSAKRRRTEQVIR